MDESGGKAEQKEQPSQWDPEKIFLTDSKGNKLFSGSDLLMLCTTPEQIEFEQPKNMEVEEKKGGEGDSAEKPSKAAADKAYPRPPELDIKPGELGGICRGVMKNWFKEKGFGFVKSDCFRNDVFLLSRNIKGQGHGRAPKELNPGDHVLFTTGKNEKRGEDSIMANACWRVSSLHLAYCRPFLDGSLSPGKFPFNEDIELIVHPVVEKRTYAPLKARTKDGCEVGSLRRIDGNRLVLLFNRNKVRFKGAPKPEYDNWEELRGEVPLMQENATMLGETFRYWLKKGKDQARRDGRRSCRPSKLPKLMEFKKKIVEHIKSSKTHCRSHRISRLRDLLPKSEFNLNHYGYKKFKDFMADIPEIEFINENKVKLKGQSRKRTLAPDSTTETQGSAGKKPKEEAAAATDPAKVVDATAPKEEKKAE